MSDWYARALAQPGRRSMSPQMAAMLAWFARLDGADHATVLLDGTELYCWTRLGRGTLHCLVGVPAQSDGTPRGVRYLTARQAEAAYTACQEEP